MRQAFSLLTAIFVVLLLGTILALTLSTTSFGIKQTSDLYMKEQAQLLAKSAVEYELLLISGHDFSVDCHTQSDYTLKGMTIHTDVYYLGNGMPCSGNTLANNIATVDSNGTAMIDVIVTYTDPSTGEEIRYFRRTLQKP